MMYNLYIIGLFDNCSYFEGLSYLQSLNFERIVMCQLNPLKICIPSVVNLFAAITRYLFCLLCFHLDTSLWMCVYNNSSYLELKIYNTKYSLLSKRTQNFAHVLRGISSFLVQFQLNPTIL